MRLKKIAAAVVILVFALACMGCTGGDGDERRGRSAARLSIGKKKDPARASAGKAGKEDALDDATPEGGMKRDLAKLRQREQRQAKLVAQLRSARNPDEARIEREEDTLYGLRGRIREYDAALQRYEMASRARPPREAGGPPLVVPDEMFRDRPVRHETAYADDYGGYARGGQPSRAQAGPEGYRSDPVVYQDERVTHARLPLGYGQASAPQPSSHRNDYLEERERVLYGSAPDEPPPYNDRQTLTAPGSLPPAALNQAQYAEHPAAGGAPFAGAPVGRARHPAPAARETGAPPPWETGPMYSATASAKPAVPDIYANRRPKEETLWPAGTAMVPPTDPESGSRPVKPSTVRLPEQERTPPPAGSAKPAGAKAPAPKTAALGGADDDVFSPDMYLGN